MTKAIGAVLHHHVLFARYREARYRTAQKFVYVIDVSYERKTLLCNSTTMATTPANLFPVICTVIRYVSITSRIEAANGSTA